MRSYILLACTVLGMFILSGCSTSGGPQLAQCNVSGSSAPLWVCRPNAGSKMIAKAGAVTTDGYVGRYTRSDAAKVGRKNLAIHIALTMRGNVEQFLKTSGGLSDDMARRISAQVARNAAYDAVKRATTLNEWEDTRGQAFYVLVAVERRYVEMMAKRYTAMALRKHSTRKEWGSKVESAQKGVKNPQQWERMVTSPAVTFVPEQVVTVTEKKAVQEIEVLTLNEEVFGALAPFGEELETLSFDMEETSVEVVPDAFVGKNRRR